MNIRFIELFVYGFYNYFNIIDDNETSKPATETINDDEAGNICRCIQYM